MTYPLRMRETRPMHQSKWIRVSVGVAIAVAAALVIVLNNCWCDQPRWLARLALIGFVGVSFGIQLIWSRVPLWVFALSVVAPVGWLIFTGNASVAPLLLLLMLGWTAYVGGLKNTLLAGGLAILAILGYVHYDAPERWLPWIAGAVATGMMTRMFVVQQSLVNQLRAAQADLAQTAVAAERRRIAGEIHDVAAHALALTVLHLTGVRLRLQRENADPRLVESLAEAERLGRQSLDDIRRTVGLLQAAPAGVAPPLPGADDIPALIEQYRAGGLPVAYALDGALATIPPATGLALYRIIQESLANVVKHAPGASVHLALETGAAIRLSIRNSLTAVGLVRNGAGHGLGGMRERAELLGGRLQARSDGGDWLVECVIPAEPMQ